MSVDEAYNIGLQDGHYDLYEPSLGDYDDKLRLAYKSGYNDGKFWYVYDRLKDFYGV